MWASNEAGCVTYASNTKDLFGECWARDEIAAICARDILWLPWLARFKLCLAPRYHLALIRAKLAGEKSIQNEKT